VRATQIRAPLTEVGDYPSDVFSGVLGKKRHVIGFLNEADDIYRVRAMAEEFVRNVAHGDSASQQDSAGASQSSPSPSIPKWTSNALLELLLARQGWVDLRCLGATTGAPIIAEDGAEASVGRSTITLLHTIGNSLPDGTSARAALLQANSLSFRNPLATAAPEELETLLSAIKGLIDAGTASVFEMRQDSMELSLSLRALGIDLLDDKLRYNPPTAGSDASSPGISLVKPPEDVCTDIQRRLHGFLSTEPSNVTKFGLRKPGLRLYLTEAASALLIDQAKRDGDAGLMKRLISPLLFGADIQAVRDSLSQSFRDPPDSYVLLDFAARYQGMQVIDFLYVKAHLAGPGGIAAFAVADAYGLNNKRVLNMGDYLEANHPVVCLKDRVGTSQVTKIHSMFQCFKVMKAETLKDREKVFTQLAPRLRFGIHLLLDVGVGIYDIGEGAGGSALAGLPAEVDKHLRTETPPKKARGRGAAASRRAAEAPPTKRVPAVDDINEPLDDELENHTPIDLLAEPTFDSPLGKFSTTLLSTLFSARYKLDDVSLLTRCNFIIQFFSLAPIGSEVQLLRHVRSAYRQNSAQTPQVDKRSMTRPLRALWDLGIIFPIALPDADKLTLLWARIDLDRKYVGGLEGPEEVLHALYQIEDKLRRKQKLSEGRQLGPDLVESVPKVPPEFVPIVRAISVISVSACRAAPVDSSKGRKKAGSRTSSGGTASKTRRGGRKGRAGRDESSEDSSSTESTERNPWDQLGAGDEQDDLEEQEVPAPQGREMERVSAESFLPGPPPSLALKRLPGPLAAGGDDHPHPHPDLSPEASAQQPVNVLPVIPARAKKSGLLTIVQSNNVLVQSEKLMYLHSILHSMVYEKRAFASFMVPGCFSVPAFLENITPRQYVGLLSAAKSEILPVEEPIFDLFLSFPDDPFISRGGVFYSRYLGDKSIRTKLFGIFNNIIPQLISLGLVEVRAPAQAYLPGRAPQVWQSEVAAPQLSAPFASVLGHSLGLQPQAIQRKRRRNSSEFAGMANLVYYLSDTLEKLPKYDVELVGDIPVSELSSWRCLFPHLQFNEQMTVYKAGFQVSRLTTLKTKGLKISSQRDLQCAWALLEDYCARIYKHIYDSFTDDVVACISKSVQPKTRGAPEKVRQELRELFRGAHRPPSGDGEPGPPGATPPNPTGPPVRNDPHTSVKPTQENILIFQRFLRMVCGDFVRTFLHSRYWPRTFKGLMQLRTFAKEAALARQTTEDVAAEANGGPGFRPNRQTGIIFSPAPFHSAPQEYYALMMYLSDQACRSILFPGRQPRRKTSEVIDRSLASVAMQHELLLLPPAASTGDTEGLNRYSPRPVPFAHVSPQFQSMVFSDPHIQAIENRVPRFELHKTCKWVTKQISATLDLAPPTTSVSVPDELYGSILEDVMECWENSHWDMSGYDTMLPGGENEPLPSGLLDCQPQFAELVLDILALARHELLYNRLKRQAGLLEIPRRPRLLQFGFLTSLMRRTDEETRNLHQSNSLANWLRANRRKRIQRKETITSKPGPAEDATNDLAGPQLIPFPQSTTAVDDIQLLDGPFDGFVAVDPLEQQDSPSDISAVSLSSTGGRAPSSGQPDDAEARLLAASRNAAKLRMRALRGTSKSVIRQVMMTFYPHLQEESPEVPGTALQVMLSRAKDSTKPLLRIGTKLLSTTPLLSRDCLLDQKVFLFLAQFFRGVPEVFMDEWGQSVIMHFGAFDWTLSLALVSPYHHAGRFCSSRQGVEQLAEIFDVGKDADAYGYISSIRNKYIRMISPKAPDPSVRSYFRQCVAVYILYNKYLQIQFLSKPLEKSARVALSPEDITRFVTDQIANYTELAVCNHKYASFDEFKRFVWGPYPLWGCVAASVLPGIVIVENNDPYLGRYSDVIDIGVSPMLGVQSLQPLFRLPEGGWADLDQLSRKMSNSENLCNDLYLIRSRLVYPSLLPHSTQGQRNVQQDLTTAIYKTSAFSFLVSTHGVPWSSALPERPDPFDPSTEGMDLSYATIESPSLVAPLDASGQPFLLLANGQALRLPKINLRVNEAVMAQITDITLPPEAYSFMLVVPKSEYWAMDEDTEDEDEGWPAPLWDRTSSITLKGFDYEDSPARRFQIFSQFFSTACRNRGTAAAVFMRSPDNQEMFDSDAYFNDEETLIIMAGSRSPGPESLRVLLDAELQDICEAPLESDDAPPSVESEAGIFLGVVSPDQYCELTGTPTRQELLKRLEKYIVKRIQMELRMTNNGTACLPLLGFANKRLLASLVVDASRGLHVTPDSIDYGMQFWEAADLLFDSWIKTANSFCRALCTVVSEIQMNRYAYPCTRVCDSMTRYVLRRCGLFERKYLVDGSYWGIIDYEHRDNLATYGELSVKYKEEKNPVLHKELYIALRGKVLDIITRWPGISLNILYRLVETFLPSTIDRIVDNLILDGAVEAHLIVFGLGSNPSFRIPLKQLSDLFDYQGVIQRKSMQISTSLLASFIEQNDTPRHDVVLSALTSSFIQEDVLKEIVMSDLWG